MLRVRGTSVVLNGMICKRSGCGSDRTGVPKTGPRRPALCAVSWAIRTIRRSLVTDYWRNKPRSSGDCKPVFRRGHNCGVWPQSLVHRWLARSDGRDQRNDRAPSRSGWRRSHPV